MSWIFTALTNFARILDLCIAIAMWVGGTREAWI